MTADSMHDCPAPGCSARVERSRLACVRHWYMIPKPLRDNVWNAYRYKGMGSEEHVEAVSAAIDWLEANVAATSS